jgi:hypothetical protein
MRDEREEIFNCPKCPMSCPWLTLHENIYHQWRNKFIDEETFSSWTRDLEFWAKRQQLANHWPQLNCFFESSFAQHVTVIIARQTNEVG